MEIEIIELIKGESYNVNGKNIYQDRESNWVAREELTAAEREAFRDVQQNEFRTAKTLG